MKQRFLRWAVSLVAALGLAALAAPVQAKLKTEEHPFQANQWIAVGMDLDGILVDNVQFHQPKRLEGFVSRHHKPNRATVILQNKTSHKVKVGIAIAIFDEEGNMLGAGNGHRWLAVGPGKRHQFYIEFKGVFREIDKGATFYITVEI